MSRRITAATVAVVTLILATGGASGGSSSPGRQAPLDQAPPSISGSAVLPNTLTASTGTWSGKNLKYAYQWLRCDSAGASCNSIAGATGSTKTLVTADVSTTLRVIVTASNRNGSAAATSAQTAAVAQAANPPPPPPPPPPPSYVSPSDVSLPAVSGTAQQNQTLSTSTGSWSGTTPMTYSYQWQRCNATGGSCAPISGATDASYVLASADVGSTIRASVTTSNSAGSATAASAATAPVTSGSPTPSGYYNYQGFEGDLATLTNTAPYETISYTNGAYNRGWDPNHFSATAGAGSPQAIRETVYNTDAGPNGSSAQDSVTMDDYKSYVHSAPGESTWYRMRIKFPSSAYRPSPGEWNWLVVWHNDNHTASYGAVSMAFGVTEFSATDLRLHLRPSGGDSSAQTQQHFYTAAGTFQYDHWYDVVIHIVWDTKASDSGGTGLIECWIDGQPPVNFVNPHPFATLFHNPDGTYDHPGLGIYNYRRNDWTQGGTSSSVDFDDWYVGPTAASVGFAP